MDVITYPEKNGAERMPLSNNEIFQIFCKKNLYWAPQFDHILDPSSPTID